jgi:hypothetical protein
VDVDRDKVLKQGIDISEVYQTLQTFMGGYFVNYFNRFGRTWQTYIEAEGDYRDDPKNVGQFYVRNSNNDPVPLDALATIRNINGPEFTLRFNEYRSAQINGAAAPGYSSSQAMKALEETFQQTMPSEMGFNYMGMSFQEKKAEKGVSSTAVFGLSLVFVFLILAALYESWSLPFSVLLSTPVAVFGAFLTLFLRHMENDVYVQIGLVMLIGSGGQERDFDRGICQGRIRKGQTAHGRCAGRCAPAPATYPDDLFSLHLWLLAVVVCQWLRSGGASRSRFNSYRRNDRRVRDCDLPYPGNLLRCGATLFTRARHPSSATAGTTGGSGRATDIMSDSGDGFRFLFATITTDALLEAVSRLFHPRNFIATS